VKFFSTDVKRNSEAVDGGMGDKLVLEARARSDLGILERLTLGLGGFRVFFFFFFFHPRLCLVRGTGLPGQTPDTIVGFHGLVRRYHAFAL